MSSVFITGANGYIGSRLIPLLQKRGHYVKALVRKGAESRLPKDCDYVTGDALDAETYKEYLSGFDVLIHLVGVAHPSPKKKKLFKLIDLESARQACKATQYAGVKKFIYLSVAQIETSVMKDYQMARKEGEIHITSSGLNYVFIRPWYIIGPGHYWPLILLPLFKLLELFPSTAAKAKALRLVYLRQVLNTIIDAVEKPGQERIIEIDEIRKF